ncbi:E2 domain-containing protein [Hyphomonas sp. BRH_c22]|uniref:E2 domain-containing protein n=1 Tax=Hyphomonas sp. BRH_c22 TaxID=1629710 RepID=UPI000B24D7DE
MPSKTKIKPGKSALDLVAQQATVLRATLITRSRQEAVFSLPVRSVDGHTDTYSLSVRAIGSRLKVSEQAPALLPDCCPNRHINSDGSFCLSWSLHQPIHVTDLQAAEAWWMTVYRFLQLQRRAAKARKWPTKDDWAHGDEAAREQMRAENAAEILGPHFQDRLRNRDLRVEKKGHFYRLLTSEGARIYSVWIEHKRVATLKQYCFCPSGRAKKSILRSCSNHGAAAADLVFGIVSREHEEKEFWRSLHGRACCKTLNNCPLQ